MAMSRRGRDSAEWAIRCTRPFKSSAGSFYGTVGPTRDLGWLGSHEDATLIKELLGRALYVVWSYNTPIGWVAEDAYGDVQRFYVEEHHSVTTSHHQGILRDAWGEYETIGQERPRPVRRRLSDSEVNLAVGQRTGSGPSVSGD